MKHSYTKPGEKSLITLLLPNDISEVDHHLAAINCLKEMMEKKSSGRVEHSAFFNVESYFGIY